MDLHGLHMQVIAFLATAVLFVPLAKRLGIGAVVGYLLGGIAIGPQVLGIIPSAEAVLHFAEFGVVLLLFLVGLELNPLKLWALRRPILGSGGLQVTLTAFLVAACCLCFGLSFAASVVAGMGIALSSTAIALQLLAERSLTKSESGEISFAVLLFQDLSVIPMLAFLPLLGGRSSGSPDPWWGVMKSIGAIAVVVLLGRYILTPVFRRIAQLQLREIFTAFSLLLVVGVAGLMQAVGLSMALGAFLSGVLLAESEYRHALESDIEPFKGLLLGLFFISVGMSIDFKLFLADPLLILFLVALLFAVKIAVLLCVGRWGALSWRDSRLFALALAQGGEFAFVLFGMGKDNGILAPQLAATLVVVVALSMLLTPLLMLAGDILARRGDMAQAVDRPEHDVKTENNLVIIGGYGRFGQIAGRILHARGIAATVLDCDPNQIALVRKFGFKAYFGDVTRLDLLHTAGAATAKVLLLAIDDMEAVRKAIAVCREHFPHLQIIARARGRADALYFASLGIACHRELFGSSLLFASDALRALGYPAYEAKRAAQAFEKYDEKLLLASVPHIGNEAALISLSKTSREELSRLLESDTREEERPSEGWG